MKKLNAFLDKHLVTLITLSAGGLFVGMFMSYFSQHATLLYGDARARLLIARRVFDSLTPGLSQLGSVWPPLPQMLSLPTIWNDFFFYSGLSGSIISILSATLATYFLARMALEISKSKFVTTVTVLAFVLNPSFLYLSTTPMTESLFISLMVISTYLIWKWSKTSNIVYLPLAGIATLAATLTRYDAWFFAAFSAIVISVIVFLKRKSFSEIEGTFFLFSTVAFSGVVAWLIYNQLIYGNMLRFATGEGSALSQAVLETGISVKLTKGDFINSSLIFLSASTLNVGIISLSVTLLASILAIIRRNYNFLLVILLLSIPLWFNIVSLFLGQSELLTEDFVAHGLYNTRYGLLVLPLTALGYGAIASILKRFRLVVLVVLLFQLAVLFYSAPITLRDATDVTYGYTSPKGTEQQKLATWIQNHSVSGLTLISALSNDSLVFDARIPMNKVVNEGSGKYWQTATKNPTEIVERIIVSPEERDSIWKVSQKKKNFFNNYTLVFSGESFLVYDLAKNNKLENTETVKELASKTTETLPTGISCNYTVQVGESLWLIAKNKLGNGNYFTKIIELNKDAFSDLPIIHPNQKILIPAPCQST